MSTSQGGESGQQWGSGQQPGPPPGGPWQGAPGGGTAGQQYPGSMQGMPMSPVNELETRVTGRRTVQWIVDAILFGIIAGLISWGLDRGTGATHAILYVVLIAVDIAWYFLYWAYWPYIRAGQTFGMQLMEIRVLSIDGNMASLGQLFVRSILLVLFTPLSLLVGFITMMASRYRQRVGDHMARTVVVRASVQPMPARREYAGASRAGSP